jgi:hypothetical protein
MLLPVIRRDRSIRGSVFTTMRNGSVGLPFRFGGVKSRASDSFNFLAAPFLALIGKLLIQLLDDFVLRVNPGTMALVHTLEVIDMIAEPLLFFVRLSGNRQYFRGDAKRARADNIANSLLDRTNHDLLPSDDTLLTSLFHI